MIPIRGDEGIITIDRSDTADGHRFLPDIDMAETTDFLVLVGLHRPHFKLADEQHVPEPGSQGFHADGVSLRGGRGRF